MTDKQERILQVALHLFASNGYDATSTSKVAKAASVSEGLIFRHFGNKEGLLEALLQQGRERARGLFSEILDQKDPKKVIKGILSMPFLIEKAEYDFWRLMYSIKWQSDNDDNSYMTELKEGLVEAFHRLEYEDPRAEAEVVLLLIDGIATAILLRKPVNQMEILTSLLRKYQLDGV